MCKKDNREASRNRTFINKMKNKRKKKVFTIRSQPKTNRLNYDIDEESLINEF